MGRHYNVRSQEDKTTSGGCVSQQDRESVEDALNQGRTHSAPPVGDHGADETE